jgi:hypothetical protein
MKFRRPRHATVVAYLALLTAVGGSAYAASRIGTNDLRDGAVTSVKIKNGNVKGKDLKRPIVRVVRHELGVGDPNTSQLLRASCKQKEQLVGGGGGRDSAAGTITFSGPDLNGKAPAPVAGYIVRGETSVTPNAIEARALCLPK